MFYPFGMLIKYTITELEKIKDQEVYDKQLHNAIIRTRKIYYMMLLTVTLHGVLIALEYKAAFIRDSYTVRIGNCLSLAYSSINLLGIKHPPTNINGIQNVANFTGLSFVFYLSYSYLF